MKPLTCAALLVLILARIASAETKNWPQFRGAEADGLGEGATLPDTWSTTENVVWKTDLPGWGWSSPVIWEKRIFVTAAVHVGPRDKMFAGGYPGGFVKPTDVHRWITYCLDFDTGKILWQREAHKGLPLQPRHPRNSFASETPICDGERVSWSQPRGSSIHPGYLISGERLYVLFDAGLLTCFNAKTGETIFPRQRLNTGGGRFYASPWAYNGKVFLLNEDGNTWVIEDSPKFNLIRKNSLGDFAWATPAISRGSLFIRTYTKLYRLQKKTDAVSEK